MKKSELKQKIKECLKEMKLNEKISKGLENFKKDNDKSEIYTAYGLGDSFDVRWTDKTFSDGVPHTKYFTRNREKSIKIPMGEKFHILETDSYWYFERDGTWYAVDRNEYGTPPFDY